MAYIGQREDEWNASQAKKARKAKAAAKTKCMHCGARVLGIKDHMRESHGCKGDGTPRDDQQKFLDRQEKFNQERLERLENLES